ncbi:cytochrome c biogenesis protein CcdA [Paenibacillus sp. P96]|uniref:Cytochrome c biogenesis protein CcdA n=1 Tax=Paenibacillus zeirhizosphaerae TaxID=2987519 RepID=A0ABT9FPV3_9BACL|nr:cytochrome c biogenesis protein CcdA [Paenibacillus sp. P96]MDP4096764.1 cytochrome c biogenesis protein CcdA [Paenibacillus sp. P96]
MLTLSEYTSGVNLLDIHIGVAFAAGLVSFASPCSLPLYPAYLSYITGLNFTSSVDHQVSQERRLRAITHTLAFVMGFSAVFYSLGAGAGLLGYWFQMHKDGLRLISSLLMMVMGLIALGWLKPITLMKDYRMSTARTQVGYIRSFAVGIGFAAGWSPCIGPMLTAIIALAAVEHNTWFSLVTGYAAGFAIPFFVLAFYAGNMKPKSRYSAVLMKLGGVMLLATGILLLTDHWSQLSLYLQRFNPEWLM